MKNGLVFALAFGLIASGGAVAHAKERPNNVGCGLGSIAWEGKEGLPPQVLAATTNGTSGNQTFGISSETSGCAPGGEVNLPQKTAMFIGPNMNRLAQDMSRGNGETLASLADVMDIDPADRPAFYAATQRNFVRIMPTETVTSGEVLASLYAVMNEDPSLRRYVAS
jgi:Protein of unknown function (DUF3015)